MPRLIPKNNAPLWQLYRELFEGHRNSVALSMLLVILQSLCLSPAPWLISKLINQAIPDTDITIIIFIALGYMGLHLLSALFSWSAQIITLQTTQDVLANIREQLCRKCFRLPFIEATGDKHIDLADLHTRILQDSQRTFQFCNQMTGRIIPNGLGLIIFTVILCLLNPWLFLANIIALPPIVFIFIHLRKHISKSTPIFHKAFEEFAATLRRLLNFRHLINHRQANTQYQQALSQSIQSSKRSAIPLAQARITHNELQGLLMAINAGIILLIGGILVAEKKLSLGDFIAYLTAFNFLRQYATRFLQGLPQIWQGRESIKTLINIESRPEQPTHAGSQPLSFQGEIHIKQLSFGFGGTPLLNDLNLHITPGEHIAICGANGTGKSTLTHLLYGLYLPDRGSIYYDNKELSKLSLANLHQQIGWVPQHPQLIDMSIADNIRLGFPALAISEVTSAIELSGASDWVNQLPERHDTLVGENGLALSGGQQQQLALARALVHNPRLLILDEPTNHLDDIALKHFWQKLKTIGHPLSIILITHNHDVACLANKIYWLHKGKLQDKLPRQ